MRRSSFVVLLVVGALLIPLGVFASHQFNDVPDSHTFHNAIDWMKDNNITVGCNPPANTRYCPDDNVTRGQMAAFMKRLAENQVVDAATLSGQDTSAYQSPIWGTSLDIGDGGQGFSGNVSAGTLFLSLEVTPATDGILAATYSVGVGSENGFWVWTWLQYDNSVCDAENRVSGSLYQTRSEAGPEDGLRQIGATLAIPTTTGSHALHLCGAPHSGSGQAGRQSASLVAIFSAVGTAG